MLAIVVSCDIKCRERKYSYLILVKGKESIVTTYKTSSHGQLSQESSLLQLFYQLKHTYNSLPLPTPMHLNSQHQILKAKSRIQKQSQKEKSLAKIKASTLRAAAIATM
jgi:hypothetical protein